MNIVPQRLRAVRIERGLSRRELAARSAISEKQLQRLEFPERTARTVRTDTLARLADALGVDPERLTGEPPTQSDAKPIRVTATLLPAVRLAYDLLESRYGFTMGQLVNAAPLFFTLIAEGSLAWRRDGVSELRAIESRLREIGGSRRFRYGYHAREVAEGGDEEERAINNSNLFDDPLERDYDQDDALDDVRCNPFADYVAKLARELGKPELVDIDPVGHGRVGGLPDVPGYRVCTEDLSQIVPLDSDGAYALHVADVRFSEIPSELAGEEKSDERRQWIERSLSPESSRWLESRRREANTTAGGGPDPAAATPATRENHQ